MGIGEKNKRKYVLENKISGVLDEIKTTCSLAQNSEDAEYIYSRIPFMEENIEELRRYCNEYNDLEEK